MSEVKKPREFWVDLDDEGDLEIYCGAVFENHPRQGPLQWQASLIHVIEKSAFDKAVEALKKHGRHFHNCLWHVRHYDSDCQCGLSNTLKELGG